MPKIHLGNGNNFFSFQNRELQIMRKLDHCNIVRLRWFFYSSGEKVSNFFLILCKTVLFFFSGEILNLKILMHHIEMYRPGRCRLCRVFCRTLDLNLAAYVGVRTLIAIMD